MWKNAVTTTVLAAAWVMTGCCEPLMPPPKAEPEPAPVAESELSVAPTPPAEPVVEVIKEPNIWLTVEDVQSDCKKCLDEAQRIRDEIAQPKQKRTLDNTLMPLNDLYIQIDRVIWPSDLFTNVSPVKAVREAAEKCMQQAMKFVSDLQMDREMYEALAAVKTDGLDATAKRFLEHELRDYRRAGVDKDEQTRKELARIKEEMVKTGQEYTRAIRDSQLFVEVEPGDLKGLPEDYIESHPAGKNGKIKITTDYPDFLPAVQYAEKQKIRKLLYLKFLSRAHPSNEDTLKKLIELRHRYATLLGSPNWADYHAGDKMAEKEKTIAEFIDKVADIARPRMKKERAQMLKRKKRDVPDAEKIRIWDRLYYIEKIQAEQFQVDAKEVRKYFDYPRVKQGLFEINQALFGVTFEKVEDATVWHGSVEAYDVEKNGEVLGRFYLDMHPREGKYGHAAEFAIYSGVTGVQLPSAALVCNFPEPSDKGPALLEHSVVTTFFHEFGHLMHQLLGGRQQWVTFSGIACEWDFVEAPSQLLEEWAWDFDLLKDFALHYETNEPISEDLVQRMRKANEFGKGVNNMRQLFLAALSLNYHNRDPDEIDLLQMVKEMHGKYSPFPYEKRTYLYASFSHLDNYSSGYYTYMWSLVLAKDMFTRFQRAGLMNQDVAAEYTANVIVPGGTVDAADMLKNFLGREYSFEAFETWLESD